MSDNGEHNMDSGATAGVGVVRGGVWWRISYSIAYYGCCVLPSTD